MTNIDQLRSEVQATFARVLSTADTAEMQPLSSLEMSLWTQLMALGRALVALNLARQVNRPRLARYEHDGREYDIVGTEPDEVGTRFGKVVFDTLVGRRVGRPRLTRDLPVSRELRL